MAEAVVIDYGKETDWYDPVEEYWETNDNWYVNNGYWIYTINKIEGRILVIRSNNGED